MAVYCGAGVDVWGERGLKGPHCHMNTENYIHAITLTSYSTPNSYMMAINFECNTVGVWDGE